MSIRVLVVMAGERGEGGMVKAVYADAPGGREDACARVLYEQLRSRREWVEVAKDSVGLGHDEVVKVWRGGCDLIWLELHAIQGFAPRVGDGEPR